MSYLDPEDHPLAARPRRAWRWVAAGGALLVLAVVAFLLGRGTDPDTGAPAAPPPSGPGPATLSWTRVGPPPVPVSDRHGPTQRENGMAAGFAHDELGAVLATINIGVRLSTQVGPAVYETTARLQTVGDIDATLDTIRRLRSTTPAGAAVPTEYFYRITGGDPTGQVVVVALAAATPQASSLGGYVGLSRTLHWVDGDWKMQVPPSRPQVLDSVDDYTRLGGPDA